MDINYLLSREQQSLYMAEISLSSTARLAHRAFAKAYGALLVDVGFPHRSSDPSRRWMLTQSPRQEGEALVSEWENEGGSIRQRLLPTLRLATVNGNPGRMPRS